MSNPNPFQLLALALFAAGIFAGLAQAALDLWWYAFVRRRRVRR